MLDVSRVEVLVVFSFSVPYHPPCGSPSFQSEDFNFPKFDRLPTRHSGNSLNSIGPFVHCIGIFKRLAFIYATVIRRRLGCHHTTTTMWTGDMDCAVVIGVKLISINSTRNGGNNENVRGRTVFKYLKYEHLLSVHITHIPTVDRSELALNSVSLMKMAKEVAAS
jgi:hypothetical protein